MTKKLIRLSIREFVERMFLEGDLAYASASPSRAVEGGMIHRELQSAAGDGYRAEVSLSRTFEGRFTALTLTGRIDGLVQNDSGTIIEEIKTVRGLGLRVGFEGQAVHWAQAKCYAAIYASGNGLTEIGVSLVYYDVLTKQAYRYDRTHSVQELVWWLEALCARWLDTADSEQERREQSSRAIKALGFPFSQVRDGQGEMISAVYGSISGGGSLFVSAPTGIGKTIGALFPAVKAQADGHCGKLFYLTARNPVKRVAEQAIRALIQHGFPIRGITLTAKDAICPMPAGTPCHPEFCPCAAGFYDRLFPALDDVDVFGHMGRGDVEALAKKHSLCPHELSLYIAEASDAVICDYNNAFDPRVRIRRFFDAGGDYALLVDEAHNLVDRARDMFSASLDELIIRAYLDISPLVPPDAVTADALSATQALLDALRALSAVLEEGEVGEALLSAVPDEVICAVRELTECDEGLLGTQEPGSVSRELLDLYFMALAFIDVYENMNGCYRVILKRDSDMLALHIRCIDPSRRLKETLGRIRAAVFFSATLTPFSYYTSLLGAGDADRLMLPSPFPKDNLKVITLSLDTTYARRDQTLPALVDALSVFMRARAGNYLVFFPSYRYMDMAHSLFEQKNPGIYAPMQSPGMGERERAEFLGSFDANHDCGMTAFAVMGGIFGEGIDLVGDRVIGVAIVGVGIPQLCLERSLMQRYHDDMDEPGYDYAYTIPGFNRVMQAVGRLIRSDSDRGAALLVDRRFGWQKYSELMPDWWQPVTQARSAREVNATLSCFWGGDK